MTTPPVENMAPQCSGSWRISSVGFLSAKTEALPARAGCHDGKADEQQRRA
jgi:hypothetical protein